MDRGALNCVSLFSIELDSLYNTMGVLFLSYTVLCLVVYHLLLPFFLLFFGPLSRAEFKPTMPIVVIRIPIERYRTSSLAFFARLPSTSFSLLLFESSHSFLYECKGISFFLSFFLSSSLGRVGKAQLLVCVCQF